MCSISYKYTKDFTHTWLLNYIINKMIKELFKFFKQRDKVVHHNTQITTVTKPISYRNNTETSNLLLQAIGCVHQFHSTTKSVSPNIKSWLRPCIVHYYNPIKQINYLTFICI